MAIRILQRGKRPIPMRLQQRRPINIVVDHQANLIPKLFNSIFNPITLPLYRTTEGTRRTRVNLQWTGMAIRLVMGAKGLLDTVMMTLDHLLPFLMVLGAQMFAKIELQRLQSTHRTQMPKLIYPHATTRGVTQCLRHGGRLVHRF